MKELICIVCPVGCHLVVEEDTLVVNGNGCVRGETYGKKEVVNPMRHITSTMLVNHGYCPVVSIKTSKEVPKAMIFEVMKEIQNTIVDAPIAAGEVLLSNVCGLDCDIIATKSVANLNFSE